MEDLIDMWPKLNTANAISKELDKKCLFEIVLVSPQARGEKHGRTKVWRETDFRIGRSFFGVECNLVGGFLCLFL